jgi:hypothetical protein
MGFALSTRGLFVDYPMILSPGDFKYFKTTTEDLPRVDYRDVLLLRNIYSSLVSGYLYHKSGRECWLGLDGELTTEGDLFPGWDRLIRMRELDPPRNGRSICKYLADESEEDGMLAYIEWVFQRFYQQMISHIALAYQVPEVGERTKIVCYENLTHPDTDLVILNESLDFFFPGGGKSWKGMRTGTNYTGSHSTSKGPFMREQLQNVVKKLDREFFNGEIGWVSSSVIPC